MDVNQASDWTVIVKRLLAGHDVTWQMFDDVRSKFAVELFGGNGWSAPSEAASDPRASAVIDLFQAMELVNPTEPAFAWNRAGLLCDLRQYVEGAHAFLEAARRLDVGIAEGRIASGEAEWSEPARAYAARALLLAGRLTTATLVCRQLNNSDYRDGIQAQIEAAVSDPAIELDPILWVPHPLWQVSRT